MSSPSVPKLPLLDGSFFFPDLINFNMQNNPNLPMWVYPNDQLEGVTEITFFEFGRAAHRIAHALRPERAGIDGQVVILIANTDTILHQVLIAGMSIAGLVPFPVSPRNSPAAVVDMMKKTNCSRIVTLHEVHQMLIDGVRSSGLEFTVEEVPPITYAFPKLGHEVQADVFIPYPHPVSRPDPNLASIYIHSSGSTGFPKPIAQTHKVQIQWMFNLMTAYFCNLSPGDRIGAMALPPFHAYGVNMQLYMPLASLVTAVVYPPRTIADRLAVPIVPTSDNVLDSVRSTQIKVLMAVPAFLEQWAASAEAVETLTKLDQVIYSGGPLADKVGNALWDAGVNITTVYGGTEFGSPVYIRQRAEIKRGEWMWMRVMEDIQVRWIPQGDDTYECQVLTTENNQMSVENLPDIKGYATSDLFVKHPTKDLWKIVCRTDDVITLASGEKVVPTLMEGIIIASPLLRGVVMFGRERNQVGVLVEPRPEHAIDVLDHNAVATFKSKIWPIIEEANKIAPAFARVFKEMVLVADSERPMIRTPKGTVQRKATIKAYEAKINILYNDLEGARQSCSESPGPVAWTTEGVLAWLMTHASTIMRGSSLDPNADLFAQGFDSLSVIYLRNQIVDALRKASDAQVRSSVALISPNIVFDNPTLQLLAARISKVACERRTSQIIDMRQQHIAAMNAMIERYSAGLPGPTAFPAANGIMNGFHTGAVVLLTGSTGGLGSFLLSQLLEAPRVRKVYALNRPSSSTTIEQRQSSAFVDKGLSVDLLRSEKLRYVEADAHRDNCGLSLELYKEIRDSVTVIIHNAWRLDFNLSLASFESNIKATRNLVDLALDAKYRSLLRFVFTSTIGTALSWDHSKGAFPEELQLDPSTAVGLGYGESKYVCERIIAESGLRATSLRIGQIAGGPNGSWATTDWVPIIVKSSIALGALPDSIRVVSWMRSEDVAATALDIAFADFAPRALNVVNPNHALWSDIMSFIRSAILEEKSWNSDHLAIVPLVEWVVRLEKRAACASPDDLVHIPALKLLEFFRAMARNEDELAQTEGCGSVFEAGGVADFSTNKARRVSKSMLKMQPLGEMEARAWAKYWISKGLF